jgi:hypothetical protein
MMAGAIGSPNLAYSSVRYSWLGLDVVSISTLYFSPSLGMISTKCLQGLPPGSFRKTLIFSMSFAPLVGPVPPALWPEGRRKALRFENKRPFWDGSKGLWPHPISQKDDPRFPSFRPLVRIFPSIGR